MERAGSNAAAGATASSASSLSSVGTASTTGSAPNATVFNSHGSGAHIHPPVNKQASTVPSSSRTCLPFLEGSGVKAIYIALLVTYLASFLLICAMALLAFDVVGMAVFGVASRAFCARAQTGEIVEIVNDFGGQYQVCMCWILIWSDQEDIVFCC